MNLSLPTIETERLSLVPVGIGDEAAMLDFERVLEQEKVATLRRSDDFYRERLMTWVRNANPARPSGMWKILDDRQIVGRAGIHWSEISAHPELSYALTVDARHQGNATEAVGALISWAFENSDQPAILAVARHSNVASIAVMRRSGMRPHPNTDDDNAVFVVMRRPQH